MRYWYLPGETIASVGHHDPAIRLVFEGDSDTAWRCLLRYGDRSYGLVWDYETHELSWLAEALPAASSWLDGWARERLKEISQGLPWGQLGALEQSTLDLVSESALAFRETLLREPALRAALNKPDKAEYAKALGRLSDRHVTIVETSPHRLFRPTLLGLLASKHKVRVKRVLDVVLSCLRAKYHEDPEFPEFALMEIAKHGPLGREDDYLIYQIVDLAALHTGGSGSINPSSATYRWHTPTDIEEITDCQDSEALVSYLRKAAAQRPWASAPLRLTGAGAITPEPSQRVVPTGRWLCRTSAECAMVYLPRGLVLIEQITPSTSPSWAVTLHYFHYEDGSELGGTHFHASYSHAWISRPEVQYAKLRIPRGDWSFASSALDLAMEFRARTPGQPATEIIGPGDEHASLVEAHRDIFAPRVEPVEMELGELRDLASELERLSEAWNIVDAANTFHKAEVLVTKILGSDHPTCRRLQDLARYEEQDQGRVRAKIASSILQNLALQPTPHAPSKAEPVQDDTERSAALVTPPKTRETTMHKERFDVAVLCALRKPELEKVIRSGTWTQLPASLEDSNTYHAGTWVTRKGSEVTVVAASPAQMGMPATAVLATKMILRFRPKLLAVVGIAAGIKRHEQGFGDILAPDYTFDYGAGKITTHDGKLHFSPDPNPAELLPRLRNRLKDWSSERRYLDEIYKGWPAQKPNTVLQLHVGPMASGAAVLGTNEPITEIRNNWRKLIGVEMEAYGAHLACREATNPQPAFLCMKSVCDFAIEKTDDWQDYAAYTSAELFRRFLGEEWEDLFLV